jgi:hypothetical protein
MNILNKGILLFLRPKVVHSIPGRMRLHVPLLKKLHNGNEDWVAAIVDLLKTPQGIDEVTPSLATGNILLRYDNDKLTESEILNFLNSITRIFHAHLDEFKRINGTDPHLIGPRLESWLQNVLSHRLHLDDQLRIPPDVFQ